MKEKVRKREINIARNSVLRLKKRENYRRGETSVAREMEKRYWKDATMAIGSFSAYLKLSRSRERRLHESLDIEEVGNR